MSLAETSLVLAENSHFEILIFVRNVVELSDGRNYKLASVCSAIF